MGLEYKGEDYIYLVKVKGAAGEYVRPFNQIDGSTSISADDVELDTKDKFETAYGKITQTVSFSGVRTKGDNSFADLRKSARNKELITIVELDTKTLKGESGVYKLNSVELDNGNGDNAEYSVEATLQGDVAVVTLEKVPDGAPANTTEEASKK